MSAGTSQDALDPFFGIADLEAHLDGETSVKQAPSGFMVRLIDYVSNDCEKCRWQYPQMHVPNASWQSSQLSFSQTTYECNLWVTHISPPLHITKEF